MVVFCAACAQAYLQETDRCSGNTVPNHSRTTNSYAKLLKNLIFKIQIAARDKLILNYLRIAETLSLTYMLSIIPNLILCGENNS